MRKVAALAVAAMEDHWTPAREAEYSKQ
jgi:hypothetical protein